MDQILEQTKTVLTELGRTVDTKLQENCVEVGTYLTWSSRTRSSGIPWNPGGELTWVGRHCVADSYKGNCLQFLFWVMLAAFLLE